MSVPKTPVLKWNVFEFLLAKGAPLTDAVINPSAKQIGLRPLMLYFVAAEMSTDS
jgi:hypothetical protein